MKMKRYVRDAVAAVMTVILTGSLAAQTSSKADADAKELASYRLTMETVNKARAATQTMTLEMKKDPKFQAFVKLEAEIEALEKKEELSEAEQRRLDALQQQKEKMEEENSARFSNPDSLDEMEAQFSRFPPMANGLRQAGMSPREYAKFLLAMFQASMVAGFRKSGMVKELPAGVSAENVRFVEEHEAELKAMQAEFEKLSKPGGR